jgi:hypothetical protein
LIHKKPELLPYKVVDAASQNKESDFDFKASGSKSVNMFWQELLNKAASGFNHFTSLGHHFRIVDLALRVFRMLHRLQHISTKAKYCYNLSIHAILWFVFGFSNLNCTRFRMASLTNR